MDVDVAGEGTVIVEESDEKDPLDAVEMDLVRL